MLTIEMVWLIIILTIVGTIGLVLIVEKILDAILIHKYGKEMLKEIENKLKENE